MGTMIMNQKEIQTQILNELKQLNSTNQELKTSIEHGFDRFGNRFSQFEEKLSRQKDTIDALRDHLNFSLSPPYPQYRSTSGLGLAIQEPSGIGISADDYYPSRDEDIEIDM